MKADNTIFNFIISPIAEEKTNDQLSEKARISSPVCSPVKIEKDAKGSIILSTTTTGATIYYSVNEGEFQLYKQPLLCSKEEQLRRIVLRQDILTVWPLQPILIFLLTSLYGKL